MDERENSPAVAASAPMAEAEQPTQQLQEEHVTENQQEPLQQAEVGNVTTAVRNVVIDDEDEDDSAYVDEGAGLPYSDHNYDTHDPSKRVKDSTVFPVIKGLSEYGIFTDEENPTADHQHQPVLRTEKVYYDQQGMLHPARARTEGVVYRTSGGEGVGAPRKVLIGGNNYTFNPSSSSNYKSVSARSVAEYPAGSGSQQSYMVSSFGGRMQRIPGSALGMQGQVMQSNVTASRKPGRPPVKPATPPVRMMTQPPQQAPMAEPPHRALVVGKPIAAPPPPPTAAYQQPAAAQSDSMEHQLHPPRAAPLLVAGRGAKPVIRGRTGSTAIYRRKDETGEQMYDEVGNPISPRKMVNFVDGIPPGGATMSSAAGTVNLVVGAPPGGVSGAPHAHGAHPAPHQEGDKEWEVNQAVLENVHAIHGKLETATGGQQKRETPQPLPVELRNAIMNGEASVRMLNFHTMVKCKHSLPDIPPDPPAAEPRPRGRPKGSTNRNRAASTSTSGAPTTASTAVLAATNGVPAALPAQSPALVTTEPLQSTPGAGVGSPRRSPSKASVGSPHRPPMGARSPQKAQQEPTEPASSPLMPQAVPPVVSVTAPPVMPADIDESVPSEDKKIETAKNETPEAPPPKARRSFAASPQRPNGVRSETSGAESMVSGGEEEEAESGAESDSSQTTEDEWGDYVTRCNCGMTHTDEHMIQCEKCDVWQHSKCMGLNIKKLPKVYLCEQCDPRPLKWNAEQARDYQERQLKLILKATEKRRAERRKRREEKRKAKERREKAKLKKAAAKAPSGSQYRKYNEIKENVYSKMARNLLALYGNTEKAPEVLACMTQVEPMFGRMFVAPGIEGIVAISDIAKHAIVMEYLGNVCLPAECQGREKMGQIQPYTILYSGLADQDSMLVIDARKLGSDSRFVRRSCRPNTVLRHVMLDGQIHVLLNATEPIEKSVEITIPFDTDFRECPRPLQCACGDEESCPIADFNSRLQKSPSPPKRKSQGSAPVSTLSSAASATTPGRKAATPKSAQTKSASKTTHKKATPASNSSKRGRPPKIKLRRPERKTAKKAETTDDEGAEGPSESARKPRLAERIRTLSSAEEPKQEEEVKEEEELVSVKEEKDDRRVSRRLRRDTDTTVSAAEKEKEVKEELEDGEIDDEDERQVPRKRTRSSTVQSTRKRGDSPKKRDDESVTRETRRKSSVVKDEKNKKEMDYTLPEDRQKMSREERKLQQQLALINKLEKEEAHKVHPKAGSPAKETKRGPKSPMKAERDASETRQRKTPKKRLLVDRIKQEERSPAPTRSSPRSPRKESLSEPKTELGGEPMEDDSEAQSRPIMAPPRRRWQQEQQMKEMEARNLPPDVHPSSGRKVWLLRRAQLDQRSEEPPPDPAPSVQRSPPRMQSPHRIESSLPPKKRRHLYSSSTPSTSDIDDALSRNEAAHLLTQMAATSSKSTSKEPEQSVRKMIRDLAYSIVRTTPAEEYSLPGPAKGSGGDESEWPSPSPAPQLKKKRVSLDEYKKRRDGGPGPGPAGSSTSTAENNKKKSFIPDMQVVQEDVRLGPLPNPKELGSPKEDLEELKRRIYGETSSPSSSKDVILPPPPPPAYPNTSGLTPPPPPPDLPPTSPAKSTTSARGSPQKRDGGESTDDDGPRHPRMSVADRLKGLFGGLIGTP